MSPKSKKGSTPNRSNHYDRGAQGNGDYSSGGDGGGDGGGGGGGPSTLNIIMLYVGLVSLGIVGGYFTFYAMFVTACEDLMRDSQVQSNISKREMEEKYSRAISDHEQCRENAKSNQALHEMKGRVTAHNELAERHQTLLEKHEKVLVRVSELQKTQDGSSSEIQKLRDSLRQVTNQLDNKSQELREANNQKNTLQASLQKRLELSQNLLQDKLKEIANMKIQGSKCNQTSMELRNNIFQLQGHMSRRQHGMTIMRYGEGPFTVQFTVAFGPEKGQQAPSQHSFEILVDALNEMPHAVWTFLSLVNHGFYDNTNFVYATQKIVKGGNPRDTSNAVRSRLTREYAEFGYGVTPLTFSEVAPKYPCAKFGVSMDRLGPDLVIHMSDDSHRGGAFGEYENAEDRDQDFTSSCFGKIIQGREVLMAIQKSPTDGNGNLKRWVKIANVRVLGGLPTNEKAKERVHDEF